MAGVFLAFTDIREEAFYRFSYNPENGEIVSNIDYHRHRKGKSVGCLKKSGYVYVKIGQRHVLAHRLAWLLYYGKEPTQYIDHINGVRNDNRIQNLRDVDLKTNLRCKLSSEGGVFYGTTRHRRDKSWQAYGFLEDVDTIRRYLGQYPCRHQAAMASCLYENRKFIKEIHQARNITRINKEIDRMFE